MWGLVRYKKALWRTYFCFCLQGRADSRTPSGAQTSVMPSGRKFRNKTMTTYQMSMAYGGLQVPSTNEQKVVEMSMTLKDIEMTWNQCTNDWMNTWMNEMKWNEIVCNNVTWNEMKWNYMHERNTWNEWLNVWVTECLNDWMTACLTDWRTEWMNEWVSDWLNEMWLAWNEWNEKNEMNEWMKWKNEMNEWLDDMEKWNEWMKLMNEWMDEWMTG